MARVSLSRGRRFAILLRDNFRCVYCGKTAAEVKLHVDHVTPVIMGGNNSPSNLAASCEDCNLGKGAMELGTCAQAQPVVDEDEFEKRLRVSHLHRVEDLLSLWEVLCGNHLAAQAELLKATLREMTEHLSEQAPLWAQRWLVCVSQVEHEPERRLSRLRYGVCFEALQLGVFTDPLFIQGDGVFEPPWKRWPEMQVLLRAEGRSDAEISWMLGDY